MKKNILKATLVAAFGLIAGVNVYNSQKSDVMSDLALANVEALATGEDDWSYRLFPCAHKPWNECVLSTDTRRDPFFIVLLLKNKAKGILKLNKDGLNILLA